MALFGPSSDCGSVYLWNYQYITTGFLVRNCHHRHHPDCLVSDQIFCWLKYFNFTFYFSSDVSVELLKLFSPLLLLLNQFCFDLVIEWNNVVRNFSRDGEIDHPVHHVETEEEIVLLSYACWSPTITTIVHINIANNR